MAIQKVLGIETEYGIVVRGGESNPIAASSVLINAYVQDLARAARPPAPPRSAGTSRTSQPGNDARGFSADGHDAARGRDPPRQRGAHQRRPLLRRPRPPRAVHARVRRPAVDRRVRPGRRADPAAVDGRGRRDPAAGPGDRRLQEQLATQGQQLRLPRELPDGPAGAVRPDRHPRHCRTSSPARSSPAPARSAPRRRASRSADVPFQLTPARRLLRGGGRPRDHAQAPDRQHPRRAPRRRRRSTGAST